MVVQLNFWAIIAAAIIPMVVGTLWYSPALFGPAWMKMVGLKEMKPSAGLMVLGGLVSLLTAYVLAHVVDYMSADTWLDGAKAGSFMWLGFIAAVYLNQVIWEKKPFNLFLIGGGATLVNLIIMGIILTVWR